MHGLKLAGINLDRKVLAETATADASQFNLLIDQAKAALASAAKK
jgi:large subunit ribosomal protein L20